MKLRSLLTENRRTGFDAVDGAAAYRHELRLQAGEWWITATCSSLVHVLREPLNGGGV
jgi:hypothetical protein